MDILRKLTIKNLKLNRKRSIVTIIGIMLSVALLVAISSLYEIGMKSLFKHEALNLGDYHVIYYDLEKKDLDTLKQNHAIDKIDINQFIGCAKTDSKEVYDTYAYIQGCNKSTLEKFIKLSDGRLPQNDNELLISNHTNKIGETWVKLGDKITLNVGQKADKDGKLVNKLSQKELKDYYENCEEIVKNEQIINAKEKTYTIVGIMKKRRS